MPVSLFQDTLRNYNGIKKNIGNLQPHNPDTDPILYAPSDIKCFLIQDILMKCYCKMTGGIEIYNSPF